MANISIEYLEGKADSLYRLVIGAAKRASQLARPDSRPLVSPISKKPPVIALEEIIADKIKVVAGDGSEDDELGA